VWALDSMAERAIVRIARACVHGDLDEVKLLIDNEMDVEDFDLNNYVSPNKYFFFLFLLVWSFTASCSL
jgi:Na+-transporting NADH:ubiquinone oxidoreductase subunit NqrA